MDTQAVTVHVNQAIEDLRKMNLKLRERMNSQIMDDSSSQILKQIECLSGRVRTIESEFDQNTNKLRDIEASVVNLSEKVNDLSPLLCKVNRKEITKECALCPVRADTVKNKTETTNTIQHCSDDESLRINKNKKDIYTSKIGNEKGHSSTSFNDKRVTGSLQLSEVRNSKTSNCINPCKNDIPCNEISTKDADRDNQVPSRCYMEVEKVNVTDKPSALVYQQSNKTNNRSNNKSTQVSTEREIISGDKDRSGQATSKTRNTRSFKNEFGYKRRLSELQLDNRVSFHNNQKCFEGTGCIHSEEVITLPTETHSGPNIKPNQPKAIPIMKSNRHDNSGRTVKKLFPDEQHMFHAGTSIIGQKTITEWLEYQREVSTEACIKIQLGTVQRGHTTGTREVYIVLDTSERLKGYKFDIMKTEARNYIQGVKQISINMGLVENVGIATFGGESQIIQVATSDYDLLLRILDKLKPSGDAPVVGGLLMGMAGILSGPLQHIVDSPLQGHIIIFTDATSGLVTPLTTRDICVQSIIVVGDFRGPADTEAVIAIVAGTGTKIYYVPISEDQHNPTLEKAVKSTNGKIIRRHEMYRLVRMSQVIYLAANIAHELRHLEIPTTEIIKRKIAEASNLDDTHGDCVGWVLELLNPLASENRKGKFVELNCRTLALGDRVQRGPDWIFGDQDAYLPGTVVGQKSNGLILVEWDHGHDNMYLYDEDGHHYNIMKVDKPRILVDEMIAVGCRVTRGQNWKYGNTDGGPASLGTVLQVRQNGKIVVRWDCRKTGLYKMGSGGKFEVRLHSDSREYEKFENSDDSVVYPRFTDNNTDESNSRQSDITNRSNLNKKNDFDYVIPIYSDTSVSAVWEFQENNTTWKEYPSDINTRIEKAYQRNKTGHMIIVMDRSTYRIHFSKMIQENPGNKTEIPVRRKD